MGSPLLAAMAVGPSRCSLAVLCFNPDNPDTSIKNRNHLPTCRVCRWCQAVVWAHWSWICWWDAHQLWPPCLRPRAVLKERGIFGRWAPVSAQVRSCFGLVIVSWERNFYVRYGVFLAMQFIMIRCERFLAIVIALQSIVWESYIDDNSGVGSQVVLSGFSKVLRAWNRDARNNTLSVLLLIAHSLTEELTRLPKL